MNDLQTTIKEMEDHREAARHLTAQAFAQATLDSLPRWVALLQNARPASPAALGHDWRRIDGGRNHFRFARDWACNGCGRSFKGENPPEGICPHPKQRRPERT